LACGALGVPGEQKPKALAVGPKVGGRISVAAVVNAVPEKLSQSASTLRDKTTDGRVCLPSSALPEL